jgi:mannosyltransferase OCH1-like enzyme
MKIITKIILAFFIYTGLAMSCDKDDDNTQQQETTAQQTQNTAQSGSWKITYFFDSDQNETNHFNGFTFTFNENGSLVGVNGSTTITGTWSVTDSNSSDDDGGSSDVDFNIFFASPPDFEELSDDWDIISVTNSKIELTDVSGGNGGTDFLTFEKI